MERKKEGTLPEGAAEGAPARGNDNRRPTGAAPSGRGERGRFSSIRKKEAVLRLLRGEELDALSRELGVAAGTLAGWKEAFLAGGRANLKSPNAIQHGDLGLPKDPGKSNFRFRKWQESLRAEPRR